MKDLLKKMIFLLFTVLFLFPLGAKEEDREIEGDDQPLSSIGPIGPTDSISLKHLTEIVLKKHFDIEISTLKLQEKETDILKSEGEFDPKLSYSLTYRDSDTPSASQLDGSGSAASVKAETLTHVAQIEKKFITGTTVKLPYTYTINETDSIYRVFPKSHETKLELTLSQPLIKTFSPFYFRSRLEKSRAGHLIQSEDHQEKVEKTLLDSINLFFAAQEAEETLKIKELSYNMAKQNFEFMQERYKLGKSSYIDFLEAQSQYQREEEQLAGQRITYHKSKRELWSLLSREGNIQDLTFQLKREIPQKLLLENHQRSPEELQKKAFESSHQLKKAKEELEQLQLDVDLARVDQRPDLDANITLTQSGLNSELKKANRETLDGDYRSYKADLKFQYHLRNRAAKGEHQKKQLQLEKQKLRIAQIERDLLFETQEIFSQLELNWKKIEVLRSLVEVQNQKWEQIQLKFKLGGVSPYDFDKGLKGKREAEIELLKAEVAYRKSVFEFYKNQGVLLEKI